MKRYIFSVLAIAAMLFVSCDKQSLDMPAKSNVVKVTAALDVTTKVTTGSEIGKFQWEKGDVIGVWTGAELTPFYLEDSAAGAQAGTFTGTLPEGGSISDASYAVYPYSEESTLEGATYTYKGGLATTVHLAAKATATQSGESVANFKFAHLGAAVYVSIKNIPAEAKFIFIESDKRIFIEEGTADLSAEFPKFTSAECGDWDFIELPEHSGAIDYKMYIPILPCAMTDPKFRFTLFSDADWGAEFPKDPYNHYGYLGTGGYINRGDLFVLPEVTF